MLRRVGWTIVSALGACGAVWAQTTPPIQPGTPDIQVPPPVKIGPPKGADPLDGKPLTAQEAAKLAVQRHKSLVGSRAAARGAAGRRREADARLGPSLTLDAGYSDVNRIRIDPGSSSGGTSNGYSTSIGLSQLLFDFSHSQDVVRQAAYLEEAARRAVERDEAELVFRVKKSFYGLVQGVALTRAAEQNVKNRQAQLALAQARLDSGLGAPIDVVNAKTFLADAVTSLTQARATESTSRMALASAMGLDPRTAVVPAESAERDSEFADLGALVDEGLKARPEHAQAVAVLSAARAGFNAAKSGNAPGLYFNAGFVGRGTEDPFRSQNATYGVTLSWTLFDAGAASGRVQQARAGVETAEADLELTDQAIIADVAQAYLELRTAEQRSTVAEANLANAREGVRLAEGRYRAGVATFLEVTSAQTSLFASESSVADARAAILTARAAIERAVGRRVP